MSKVIKSITINVVSSDTENISSCQAIYEVAHSEDETLRKTNVVELSISLEQAELLVAHALEMAEAKEGIS